MLNIEQSVEDKYNIVYVGPQHYYKEDLSKRDYSLENTTPFYLRIGGDEFLETTWLRLNQAVANYLIEEYQLPEEKLLEYELGWSKQKMFYKNNEHSNFIKLDNGLYLNGNQTAVHAMWILQDMFKLFGVNIDDCEFLIHRHPVAEQKEVRDYYIERHKYEFRRFMLFDLKEDIETYDKCIHAMDAYDKYFNKKFPTFVSFYLFDRSNYFGKYKADFILYLESLPKLPREKVRGFERRLNYYHKFMSKKYPFTCA